MATSSILKNIDIKDSKLVDRFVTALEHASERPSKEVKMSKSVKNISKDKIKSIFV